MHSSNSSNQTTDVFDSRELLSIAEYLKSESGAFWENTGRFIVGFLRKHRAELLRKGAVYLSRGRNGTLIHPARMESTIHDILERERLQLVAELADQ